MSNEKQLRFSKNGRESISDVKIFLEREHVDRAKTIEVVCSSARRDMDDISVHTPYRLFSNTLTLSNDLLPVWPEKTDFCCWHCCHLFDTVPLPIPKAKSIYESRNIYHVYGIFCSCNCAVAYLLERNTHDQQHLLLRFKEMAASVFKVDGINSNVFIMEPAPPRIFLKMFGGHLTIEEFRRNSLVTRTSLLSPPFVSFRMVLEESARSNDAAKVEVGGPITSHAIRGLRRPTTREDEEIAPAKTDGDTSLFSKFLASKQAENNFAPSMGVVESKGDKRVSAKRSHSRRATVTKSAPVSGTGGTLAAFLVNSKQ